jgi:uncharacterized membrane protein
MQMNTAGWIWFWGALFVISHLVISSKLVRPKLVGAAGAQAYLGIYSLVAFATLVPLIFAFSYHKHSGPMLWYLRNHDTMRGLSMLLMLFAFIFFAGSLVNPAPSGIRGAAIGQPHRILKITRHPSFVAFILFGFAHLLMNGWLGDIGFFGTFSALGIVGGLHQDSRKLGELGAGYSELKRASSFFPGAAIISGRQRFGADDVPWLAIGLGVALFAITLGRTLGSLAGEGAPFH